MTTCRVLILVFGIYLGTVPSWAVAADLSVGDEYRVKAAFLYNFIHYIEWPVQAPSSKDERIAVCSIGRDPFGKALDELQGKVVRNRRLEVRRLTHIEEARDCQMLFVSAGERIRLPVLLNYLKNRPVLTVSDMEGFIRNGGMIGLITLNDKVRFEINAASAQQAHLKVSSQLLKLARDVQD